MTLQAFCLACTQSSRRRRRLCWRQVSWRRLNLRLCAGRERESTWERERERDWARQVFSSSPMCSLLLQREIERTQHDTCCSHTHRDSHSLSQSPLWSSRALPLSLSRMHTLCKLLLLLTHPSTFVVVALNSTKKKKKRKMSRPQNQNHDATKATTITTTAGVALFIVAVVVVFRIIVRYVLFVARYKTSLSRRCLRLLRRRRLSLVFSFNFVYFEFSQNFLEFLLHSHSLHSMAICCYSFSN